MTSVQFPVWREAPRDASMSVAGGSANVYNRTVPVVLSTRDYATGLNNVSDMKIWGDIDPGFHPEMFGTTEGASKWIQFEGMIHIVLSVGAGEKVIHAKIRNSSNAEVELEDSTNLKVDIPHPSVLWHDRHTVTVDAPSGTYIDFAWSPSVDHGGYLIAMAKGTETSIADIPISGGLVYGDPGSAGDINWERISVEDVLAADPAATQAGGKVIKIFVLANGIWWSGDPGSEISFTEASWDYDNWDEGAWV